MVVAWLVSYAIGSVPTAYLLARGLKGVDIRTVGSGNVGATNAARVLGPWIGLVVFAVDVLKGVVAVVVVPRLLLPQPSSAVALSCGLAAVIGHDVPVWLRGRGGKGVATTIGALVAGAPLAALAMAGAWLLVFGCCRYVSVASMSAAITVPVAQSLWHQPRAEVFVGVMLAMLIVVQHRGNLRRLLAGTEPRGFSRQPH